MKNCIEYKGIWISKFSKAYLLWEAKDFKKLDAVIKLLNMEEETRGRRYGK